MTPVSDARDIDLSANPFRLNLEQQKKRAKELQRGFANGEATARLRYAENHPKTPEVSKLADAQLVIARELGVASWAKLKDHIAELTGAEKRIQLGAPTNDTDRVLHIRCGTDIQDALPLMGLSGDFLEFSDPYVQGPVVNAEDWQNRRAEYLDKTFGAFVSGSAATLEAATHRLESASRDYDHVVLWFEHDSFDQLILIRVLAVLGERTLPATLEMVSIDSFPGMAPFWGLGQLPPEALRLLWERRVAISEAQMALGSHAWKALGSPSPETLHEISESSDLALPYLGAALKRHLAELPDHKRGLSLTQQLILEVLGEGALVAGQVFRELMVTREPLPWLGDIMFWAILKEMAGARDPVLVIAVGDEEAWPSREVTLTELGLKVLDGECDYLEQGPAERWVGGVRIVAGGPVWRWDADKRRPCFGS